MPTHESKNTQWTLCDLPQTSRLVGWLFGVSNIGIFWSIFLMPQSSTMTCRRSMGSWRLLLLTWAWWVSDVHLYYDVLLVWQAPAVLQMGCCFGSEATLTWDQICMYFVPSSARSVAFSVPALLALWCSSCNESTTPCCINIQLECWLLPHSCVSDYSDNMSLQSEMPWISACACT